VKSKTLEPLNLSVHRITIPPEKPLLQGIINLDKPAGITSAKAVGRVKHLLPRGTRIGHAGTLDPFATGVLLLLVGKATKSCESLMDQPKAYEATVKLGGTTATDDLDSPETPTPNAPIPTRAQIESTLPRLTGVISQRPPNYSALKIGGRRAYDLARHGKAIELPPRDVRIDRIDLLDYSWPLLKLRIDCGRGTYIRSIARDLGQALNTGGYLTQLRRTRVGQFTIDDAVLLDQLLADGPESHMKEIKIVATDENQMNTD
jgi:tRNA pseudouridine55 synthase